MTNNIVHTRVCGYMGGGKVMCVTGPLATNLFQIFSLCFQPPTTQQQLCLVSLTNYFIFFLQNISLLFLIFLGPSDDVTDL